MYTTDWVSVDNGGYPPINKLVITVSDEEGKTEIHMGFFRGDYWDLQDHKRPLDGPKRVHYWQVFVGPVPMDKPEYKTETTYYNNTPETSTELTSWWIINIHDTPHKAPYCENCKGEMMRDEYRTQVKTNYCPHCGARIVGQKVRDYKVKNCK